MAIKPKSLSQSEHDFARAIVYDGLTQAEAYRVAYEKADLDDAAARVYGCTAAKRPHVKAEIDRLRDELSEKSLWSRVDSINTLKSVIQNPDKSADIVASVKELNKMFGWDKVIIDHTSSDGSMRPTHIVLTGPDDDGET